MGSLDALLVRFYDALILVGCSCETDIERTYVIRLEIVAMRASYNE